MRSLILTLLVSCIIGAAAGPLCAQATQAPAPPDPAQAKPATQQPAPTPAPGNTPAATPPASAPTDIATSLFEILPNQFEFGGRWSTQQGDAARFQRYQDFGDGALFNVARIRREAASGEWLFTGAADNVGWRDQQYFGLYQRPGHYTVTGLWNQIPQFYSIDTKTPFTASGNVLTLDDATQRAIQLGQATLAAYLPLAPRFDLREQRDIGNFQITMTPTTRLDLTGVYTAQRHIGELPWGASFGFGNDVEVALPYRSLTNDVTLGTEWTDGRKLFRIAYEGSWFNNHSEELIWDSPLRLDDSATAPGRGRMALWPSNSAQTVTAAGFWRWPHRTQLTGAISYALWRNNEPLQPFTINAALPQLTLPRDTAEAEARVFATNLNFISHPITDWSFAARARVYDFNNKTGHVDIPQFINYDTSITTSSTGGPEPYAHRASNVDADAIYVGLEPVTFTVGYTFNGTSNEFRIFKNTSENVLRLAADAIGTQWVTFQFSYQHGNRTGSGLNEDLLVEIGEQPAMRHYDLADRTRNQFNGLVNFTPNDRWLVGFNIAHGNDDFDHSGFGLQEASYLTWGVAADVQLADGWVGGMSYNREHYDGLQRSRQANPGQENDPTRDWTVESGEIVNYFGLNLTTPRWRDTEARFSYDYSFAEGDFLYTIVPGGPLTPPNQLPHVFNKLQQLNADVRHRFTNNLAGTFSYFYEPYRVFDFAFDPRVIDSIVQPSSLVMGYVYRPYTAHVVVVGIKYIW